MNVLFPTSRPASLHTWEFGKIPHAKSVLVERSMRMLRNRRSAMRWIRCNNDRCSSDLAFNHLPHLGFPVMDAGATEQFLFHYLCDPVKSAHHKIRNDFLSARNLPLIDSMLPKAEQKSIKRSPCSPSSPWATSWTFPTSSSQMMGTLHPLVGAH